MVNLFFNLYLPEDAYRASELLTCFQANFSNRRVERLIVYFDRNLGLQVPAREHGSVVTRLCDGRPTFSAMFADAGDLSSSDDVNIICNSDCIVSERAVAFLRKIHRDHAYCCRRRELLSAIPLVFDRGREEHWRSTVPNCMHDAWCFRGKPRSGMDLAFSPGTPGCDNRIAYEFSSAGYKVAEVFESAPVYHLHRSLCRAYSSQDAVAGPYIYPRPVHMRERVAARRFAVSKKLRWWCQTVASAVARRSRSSFNTGF